MGRDLYMATSSDEGAHWSEPVKLDVDILVIAVVAPFRPPLMRRVLHVVQRNQSKPSPPAGTRIPIG